MCFPVVGRRASDLTLDILRNVSSGNILGSVHFYDYWFTSSNVHEDGGGGEVSLEGVESL